MKIAFSQDVKFTPVEAYEGRPDYWDFLVTGIYSDPYGLDKVVTIEVVVTTFTKRTDGIIRMDVSAHKAELQVDDSLYDFNYDIAKDIIIESYGYNNVILTY